MTPKVRVTTEPFDLAAEARALAAGRTDVGAIVTFTGICRGGEGLAAMTLETYQAMAEKELSRIAGQAAARWPLTGLCVIHRFGRMEPGDDIVLVVAASAHRQAAFEAASFLMDYLKTQAPFWKKEERADGTNWVEARDSDDAAAARWNR